MSIQRTYFLSCDSISLLIRREHASGKTLAGIKANRPARENLIRGCVHVSRGYMTTSKDARAAAKRSGWVRHSENVTGRGVERFDLCPNCAPKVVAR